MDEAARTEEVVRRGSWLYDGKVRTRVWILRRNYFSHETDAEPPWSNDGWLYFSAFGEEDSRDRSRSRPFSSFDEAVRDAGARVRGPIEWSE